MYKKQILRYVSGNYTPEDEEFIRQWLAEDPARRETLEQLREVWELTGKLDIGDVDRAWTNLSNHTIKKKMPLSRHRGKLSKKPAIRSSQGLGIFLKIAAALMIVAGAYAFYQYSMSVKSQAQSNSEQVVHTISSQRGEQMRFRFSDGTEVVLNASSQIRYREGFGQTGRDVYLQGEAYFEVNHNHPLPFVVYAGGARIEDIGTKFNIRAYPNLKDTEVVVAEGKVRVSLQKESGSKSPENKNASVIVSQGQGVYIKDNEDQLQVHEADLHQTLSWLQKQLIFDGAPLAEVAEELERYYDINIEVTDSSLLDKRITASFEDERMENVLKVLALSMDADYNLDGDNVRFFLKKKNQILINKQQ